MLKHASNQVKKMRSHLTHKLRTGQPLTGYQIQVLLQDPNSQLAKDYYAELDFISWLIHHKHHILQNYLINQDVHLRELVLEQEQTIYTEKRSKQLNQESIPQQQIEANNIKPAYFAMETFYPLANLVTSVHLLNQTENEIEKLKQTQSELLDNCHTLHKHFVDTIADKFATSYLVTEDGKTISMELTDETKELLNDKFEQVAMPMQVLEKNPVYQEKLQQMKQEKLAKITDRPVTLADQIRIDQEIAQDIGIVNKAMLHNMIKARPIIIENIKKRCAEQNCTLNNIHWEYPKRGIHANVEHLLRQKYNFDLLQKHLQQQNNGYIANHHQLTQLEKLRIEQQTKTKDALSLMMEAVSNNPQAQRQLSNILASFPSQKESQLHYRAQA